MYKEQYTMNKTQFNVLNAQEERLDKYDTKMKTKMLKTIKPACSNCCRYIVMSVSIDCRLTNCR